MAELVSPPDRVSLVEQHQKLIAVLCRRMLGPGENGIDAAQSIWEAVFESLPQFRAESSVSTWIYRIAVRTLLRIRQSQQRETLRAIRRRYHIDEIPSPADFRPDYQFWVRDSCERCMQGVLFCLSPETRLVFIFRFISQLGYPEIAAIMDKTPLAIRQIASRGRRTVQRFILNDCAFAHADACCRCGMDRAIRSVRLREEFERLRLLVKRIDTWKLADQILPPQEYWLRYAPDYAKSLSQNPGKQH